MIFVLCVGISCIFIYMIIVLYVGYDGSDELPKLGFRSVGKNETYLVFMKTFYSDEGLEIGVDEAGRGPLFGRVYAAAVIWPPGLETTLIRDSKDRMYKREGMYDKAFTFVKDNAIAYGIAYSDEATIDEKNILQATMDAMHKAIDNCGLYVDQILVDGNYFKLYTSNDDRPVNYVTVEKGDSTYYSIAAASILAKVSRDRYIVEICNEYPELEDRYGLLRNKGYGQVSHLEGIKNFGISQFHRQTFGSCKTADLNPV